MYSLYFRIPIHQIIKICTSTNKNLYILFFFKQLKETSGLGRMLDAWKYNFIPITYKWYLLKIFWKRKRTWKVKVGENSTVLESKFRLALVMVENWRLGLLTITDDWDCYNGYQLKKMNEFAARELNWFQLYCEQLQWKKALETKRFGSFTNDNCSITSFCDWLLLPIGIRGGSKDFGESKKS